MTKVVLNNPSEKESHISGVSTSFYYIVIFDGKIGTIIRERWGNGTYRLINGGGIFRKSDVVEPGDTTLTSTIHSFIGKGYTVYQFTKPRDFFRWLAENIKE